MKKSHHQNSSICIGWTSFENKGDAERCASKLISSELAFCVQVESEVTSYYNWENNVQKSQEFSVRIKHLDANGPGIKDWLIKNHPYDIPQWISIKACDYLEEYLNWAHKNSRISQNPVELKISNT
jgi:periplasmic divalent cation tolerance protein